MGAIANSLASFWSLHRMARPAALAAAALTGLLLTACGGAFGQSGVSLPNAGDDLQTVSDAADSLIAHHSSATQDAKAAIGVTDALGSIVRDVSDDEHLLLAIGRHGQPGALRGGFSRSWEQFERPGAAAIYSASQLLVRPGTRTVSTFCDSSAGFGLKGIPSLGRTFGWESGSYSGGTRTTDGRGLSTWSATATGRAVEAPIGGLSLVHSATDTCPVIVPAFAIAGATASDDFSIPLSLTFRSGNLWDLSISNATFSGGESLNVVTSPDRHPTIAGTITAGSSEIATFRVGALGNGTLTVTSSGAQYAISDWVVVGI